MQLNLESLVVRHALRVPRPTGPAGQGDVAARQLDAALMSVGFKLSGELLTYLSGRSADTVAATAERTLGTVRELVGDHVRHNSYFVDFPANVPDTFDFWMRCILEALSREETRDRTLAQLSEGVVNLLTLPSYGRYQHTYEEMLAAHDELVAAAGDRMTVLHLGDGLDDEVARLYLALAGSRTPLGDEHVADLAVLAERCVNGPQPEAIPVRENRAVVNAARVKAGSEPLLDTVTDVLRLACALSDGDVSLREPTRFRGFSRRVRRTLLAGLDAVIEASPAKLTDVLPHPEVWKRLGERLHPHEYPHLPYAADVFAVARGEKAVRTFDSRVEELLARADLVGATRLLASVPGKLYRSLDRLLCLAATDAERASVLAAADEVAGEVSGRVVLSVREHLLNRTGTAKEGDQRVFVNRLGRAWATDDRRAPVPAPERQLLEAVLDREIRRRLPAPGHLLIDPEILDVAVPLSGRATTGGFGVLARGSTSWVEGELLRFFTYWKERSRTTDFDLSALILDAGLAPMSWLSWTELENIGGEHSGDIVEAPNGATEFINLSLDKVQGTYIVPQVDIYAGESFDEVEESFFGFMLRDSEQKGMPFEPRTVRMKSELRGPGRVALPLVFERCDDGRWRATWLHLYLKGRPAENQVENNHVTVTALLRGALERTYLTVRHLTELMAADAESVTLWDGETVPEGPVTWFGLSRPEGLHPESRVFTPENLGDVVPG